jgi:hypothetical protein
MTYDDCVLEAGSQVADRELLLDPDIGKAATRQSANLGSCHPGSIVSPAEVARHGNFTYCEDARKRHHAILDDNPRPLGQARTLSDRLHRRRISGLDTYFTPERGRSVRMRACTRARTIAEHGRNNERCVLHVGSSFPAHCGERRNHDGLHLYCRRMRRKYF